MADDDDVAIDDGMEEATSIEDFQAGKNPDAAGGGDDGDEDPGDFVTGTAVEVVGKRRHTMSDRTRQLAKAAAEKFKAERTAEDDQEGDFGEYDEAPVASLAAKPAAPREPAPLADPTKADQVAPPPAPSLDPEVVRLRAEWQSKAGDLDAREQAIADRERAGDLAKMRTAYTEHGASAVRDFVKATLGEGASEDDLRAEVSDLISELSGLVLGVDLPSAVRDKLESKRALRSVKAMKASMQEEQSARVKREEADRQQASRSQAIVLLDKEIQSETRAKQYAYLAAEDNPGEIIVEVCEAQHRKDGTQLSWEEAAKRADEYLRKKVSGFIDKRKHLITAAPAQAGAPTTGKAPSTQGDPQGHRRSQAPAEPEAGATPPLSTDGKWNREAHRSATRRKFRKAFTAQQLDDE